MKIAIHCQDRVFFAIDLSDEPLPYQVERAQAMHAGDAFGMEVRRERYDEVLRWKLGGEVIWQSEEPDAQEPWKPDAFESPYLPDPGSTWKRQEQTDMRAWLRNELGESQLVLEKRLEEGHFQSLFCLPIEVVPRPSVYEDFLALIEDIVQVHAGLIQDVIGRAWIKQGLLSERVTRLQPQSLVPYLEALCEQVSDVVARIAKQPCKRLVQEVALVRYRGGERLDHTSLVSLVRSRETRFDSRGRITQVGKIRTRRLSMTEELEEHRHIAAQIRRHARKSKELAQLCEQRAQVLEEERRRWGSVRGGAFYESLHGPRIQAYRELAGQASRVAERFRNLVQRHSFLSNAEAPRTTFGPTPVFQGRPSYHRLYRLLAEAHQRFGILVDEDAVRIHTKDFPTLFEMWCFLRVVEHLNERLGTPLADPPLPFSQEIYHPSLNPGQRFVYKISRRIRVEVCYEQEFYPWRRARERGDMWGAAFTPEPLRPDVTLTVFYHDEPPVMLILDAKSSDSFTYSRFRSITDYSRQIFGLKRGDLPVKQVFLLHRDRSRTSPSNMTNVPHYLKGKAIPFHTTILGAIPAIPGDDVRVPDLLPEVLDRFLEIYADFPP